MKMLLLRLLAASGPLYDRLALRQRFALAEITPTMKINLVYPSVVMLSLIMLAGCVVRARPVVAAPVVMVATPPPPLRVEAVPPLPGAPRLYVWQPGHWRWNGAAYLWMPGHYDRRPAARAMWAPAEWVARDGQWVFRPGHWVYR